MNIEEMPIETLRINSFDENGLDIGGTVYHHAVILGGGKVSKPIEQMPQDLTVDSFRVAYEAGVEVVLIGTGEKQVFLHPKIMADLASRGIGLESMNTAAACRTWMMLQSEGRSVWAWLWP